ncbi:MAG: hypothetical protein AAGD38_07725 [Acidobacteriota bacterium]
MTWPSFRRRNGLVAVLLVSLGFGDVALLSGEAQPAVEPIRVFPGTTTLVRFTLDDQHDHHRFHTRWKPSGHQAGVDVRLLRTPTDVKTFEVGRSSPLIARITVEMDARPQRIDGILELENAESKGLIARIPIVVDVKQKTLGAYLPLLFGLGFMSLIAGSAANGYFRQTRRIDASQLAQFVEPLERDPYPSDRMMRSRPVGVRASLNHSLSSKERWWRWLLGNPVLFGIPGWEYNETLKLTLNNVSPSVSSRVIGLRNALKRVFWMSRVKRVDRIFVAKGKGAQNYRFFIFTSDGKTVGGLELCDASQRRLSISRRTTVNTVLLLRPLEHEDVDSEEGPRFLGWRLDGDVVLIREKPVKAERRARRS